MYYNFCGHFWGKIEFFLKIWLCVFGSIGGFRVFCVWVLFLSSVCWFLFFGFYLMRDSILLRCLLIFDLYLFSTIWLFFVALNILLLCLLFTASNLFLLLLSFVVAKLSIVKELRLSEVEFASYVFLAVIRSWCFVCCIWFFCCWNWFVEYLLFDSQVVFWCWCS